VEVEHTEQHAEPAELDDDVDDDIPLPFELLTRTDRRVGTDRHNHRFAARLFAGVDSNSPSRARSA